MTRCDVSSSSTCLNWVVFSPVPQLWFQGDYHHSGPPEFVFICCISALSQAKEVRRFHVPEYCPPEMETSEDRPRLASVPQDLSWSYHGAIAQLASYGKLRRCPFNGAKKSGTQACEQAGCATGWVDAASTLRHPFTPRKHPNP
jgi:hypothetical protein